MHHPIMTVMERRLLALSGRRGSSCDSHHDEGRALWSFIFGALDNFFEPRSRLRAHRFDDARPLSRIFRTVLCVGFTLPLADNQ